MLRIPNMHIEGGFYYVTIHGDDDKNVFKDSEDYQVCLNLLKKYKEQYGFKLFAFVLLPNHLGLLIEFKEGITLSDIIHDLTGNYCKYFNKKYGLQGHLFQEGYKMNLMEKTLYLIYMTAYIHLYPEWLNLVPNALPAYSSFPLYLYYAGPKGDYTNTKQGFFGFDLGMKQEIMEVLNDLVEKNYGSYLRCISKEEIRFFAKQLKKEIVLGSEGFMETVKLKMEVYCQE